LSQKGWIVGCHQRGCHQNRLPPKKVVAMENLLEVQNLNVFVNNKHVIKNLNLTVRENEVHGVMGPNGSGKTTLAFALACHPRYTVSGSIKFNGFELIGLKPDERARLGLFLAHQNPQEIEGLRLSSFLYQITRARSNASVDVSRTMQEFKNELSSSLALLRKDEDFASRDLNYGFSGGEKKKSEVLQMLFFKPKLAVIDEIDSGLDVNSLELVSQAVNKLRERNKMSALVITHYTRIFKHLKPDFVHVMKNGEFVASGDSRLAEKIEEFGYDSV